MKPSAFISVTRQQPIYKEKAHGLKAQPLKGVILDSSLSVNRKLQTHILRNIPKTCLVSSLSAARTRLNWADLQCISSLMQECTSA